MILCAYFLISLFFVMEWQVRQGSDAKSLEAGGYDQGSTKRIAAAFTLTLGMLLAAPILDALQLAVIDAASIAILGLLMMIAGLLIRYWAARTLGAFYTRTLRVNSNHQIVDVGPYHYVRNPGYLGLLLLFIGSGLAASNWLVIVAITVVMLAAYIYRIRTEEAMLTSAFGDVYRSYIARTWRLIPLLY